MSHWVQWDTSWQDDFDDDRWRFVVHTSMRLQTSEMVTDKQNKQKQSKTKGKIKGGLLEEQKIPQQIYVGPGPKQGRCLQKILFREQNCVKYDCEFSESKTASSMTANFPSKLRQV